MMQHLHFYIGRIVLWIMAVLVVSCNHSCPDMQLQIKQCASIPTPLASATCFVMADKAYVLFGRDQQGNYQNHLWQYDSTRDIWTDLGETPLVSRVNATACVCDGIAYIGLGFNGQYSNTSGYLTDWWSYDPTNNIWQQLSSFPASTTARAISMVGEGELYVGYGFCWTYERDMYRYQIATDTWNLIDVQLDRKAFTFPMRSFGGVGCTCQDRHFAGTGFRAYSLNWWGELDPINAQWIKRKDVPGHKRTIAACASTENYVYVIGGMHFGGVNTDGKILDDIQQYDPQTNSWCHVGNLPNGGRMNHSAFSIGSNVYVGLGENEEIEVCGDLYCIYEK